MMQWAQTTANAAVYELRDGKLLFCRLTFLNESGLAECEAAPASRWIFQFHENGKVVRVLDGSVIAPSPVLGTLPLSWTDGGELTLGSERFEWEFTSFSSTDRRWVCRGEEIAHFTRSGELSAAPAMQSAMLAGLGWYLIVLRDLERKSVVSASAATAASGYGWTRRDSGFALLSGADEKASLAIAGSVGSGAGFQFIGSIENDHRVAAIRDADTDEQVGLFRETGVFDGELVTGQGRYRWEYTRWYSVDRQWVNQQNGKPAVVFQDLCEMQTSPRMPVEIHETDKGMMLAALGLFLLALEQEKKKKPFLAGPAAAAPPPIPKAACTETGAAEFCGDALVAIVDLVTSVSAD